MIMRPGQQLLLPASFWFIWGSLIAALLLNMLLSTILGSASLWLPDFCPSCWYFGTSIKPGVSILVLPLYLAC